MTQPHPSYTLMVNAWHDYFEAQGRPAPANHPPRSKDTP